MIDIESFEPELYGFWPRRRVYGDPLHLEADDAEARVAAKACFLEIKSGPASPAEELRILLNEMTAEMRDQFSAFRELRRAAEAASTGGDEAAAKLARADLKAATDAMSLIVRTLEKVDQLQRQIARDRELAAEESDAAMGLEDAKKRFLERIDELAEQRARQLLAEWQAAGPPGQGDAAAGDARQANTD
ncbi:hypothetical protein [Rhizobium grahamii]|uniref:Uncharacterized protein n=1 Tax=Rhizobium grahamii CCGE 502 TaxID=990285 RepID=S3I1B4_9HYPH|nr:hypothetical protein [Rhizobium grahamii]EPE99006.1 hypothetical protein RGCCGE502_06054 [Rhizobium grahamii CCGE 502]